MILNIGNTSACANSMDGDQTSSIFAMEQFSKIKLFQF